ncbi:ImuA family protein [Novosphingobium guangzhouense]|uniref:Protein ImuA n=1 Tax=Novosphingobium guangzhouense TaxID=1850347 RepID=A0A2K2FZS1_9SPHN|nr:hypothetical protein [Novosphingobium guangzhouense]PNU04244.1 hypothetical protein A8V01_20920 [Novosphingobium guangzhouense]
MSPPQAPACTQDPPPDRLPRLARAQLHEVHAGGEDWASALAFAFGTVEAEQTRPILLLRPRRKGAALLPCGEGLRVLGVDPARLVIVDARNDAALLRAGLDAARSSGPAAVLIESWGTMREYDLVASRRLILAAEGSRIPVVILRGDAEPRPSAAHTRWTVSSAPSTPLEMGAPGATTLLVELVRRRGGPAGQRWRLEWNEEHGGFRELPLDTRSVNEEWDVEERGPPLPGTVVPLPAVRTRAPLRRTA